MTVAMLLFVAALFLPHPTGIWYVTSQYPKWLVAIDSGGLTIGRETGGSWFSGSVPLLVAKLVAYGFPAWLLCRFAFRPLRGRAATRGE